MIRNNPQLQEIRKAVEGYFFVLSRTGTFLYTKKNKSISMPSTP
jgi:hypothetical protein